MSKAVETITSLDEKHRVVVFQRPEGTFGFDELYFDDVERAWCMLGSRGRSYPVCDTLERTFQEIVSRIPWAREVIESK